MKPSARILDWAKSNYIFDTDQDDPKGDIGWSDKDRMDYLIGAILEYLDAKEAAKQ